MVAPASPQIKADRSVDDGPSFRVVTGDDDPNPAHGPTPAEDVAALPSTSDSMRLGSGWVPVAPVVLRAFLAAIGGTQGILLAAVLEECWFAPLAVCEHVKLVSVRPCRLNLSRLSRETGISVGALSATKRLLIDRRILREHPDGLLEPNPEFEGWDPQGSHWATILTHVTKAVNFRDECRTGTRESLTRPGVAGKADGRLRHQGRTAYGTPPRRLKSSKNLEDLAPKSSKNLEDRSSKNLEDLAPKSSKNLEDIGPPSSNRELRNPERGESASALQSTNPPKSDPVGSAAPDLAAKRAELAAEIQKKAKPGNKTPELDLLLAAIRLIYEHNDKRDHKVLRKGLIRDARVYPSWWLLKVVKRVCLRDKDERYGWEYHHHILEAWRRKGQPEPGEEDQYDDRLNLIESSEPVPPSYQVVEIDPAALAHVTQFYASDDEPEDRDATARKLAEFRAKQTKIDQGKGDTDAR